MILPITALTTNTKRVILRADLNAPIQNRKIVHDYRLKATLPTIDYIQSSGGKVILLTHLGRPKNEQFDPELSTQIIANWLEQQGYKVDYEIDLMRAIDKSNTDFDSILIAENLRFFSGEKQTNIHFAQLLARLGDCYVNDAFGLVHRHDTSVTLLPEQFYPHRRAYGLLVEQEIGHLAKIKQHPTQPFFMVLGGCKIEDKIGMIEQLAQQEPTHRVNTILVGGLIGQILLAAQGKVPPPDGDTKMLELAKKTVQTIEKFAINLILPQDFLVPPNRTSTKPQALPLNEIKSGMSCQDIGPETIKNFVHELTKAKTVFVNGTMGRYEDPAYAQGTQATLAALAQSQAYRIIGGGDAVTATFQCGFAQAMDYLSTGGGATLAYLAAQDPENDLPALKALKE